MQKKRTQKTVIKQQQMLDVAEHLIAEHGLAALTVRAIAKQMGCAVGLLYRLFDSLDEVVIAVNLRTLQQLEADVLRATEHVQFAAEYLEVLAFAYVDYVMCHRWRWQAVTGFHFVGEVPSAYAEQQQRLFDLLEAQIAVLNPKMSADAIALEARALWVGMDGLSALAIHGKLDMDGDLGVKAIAHVLLARFLLAAKRDVLVAKGESHGA